MRRSGVRFPSAPPPARLHAPESVGSDLRGIASRPNGCPKMSFSPGVGPSAWFRRDEADRGPRPCSLFDQLVLDSPPDPGSRTLQSPGRDSRGRETAPWFRRTKKRGDGDQASGLPAVRQGACGVLHRNSPASGTSDPKVTPLGNRYILRALRTSRLPGPARAGRIDRGS